MAAGQVQDLLFWLWLPLLLAPGCASLQQLRNRTCLTHGAHALSQRRNVSLGGISQPLRLGRLNWMGPIIQEWLFRIISEEVLGINVVLAETFEGSMPGWKSLMACMDPATEAVREGYSGPHVAMGFWMNPDFVEETRRMWLSSPDLAPQRLGSVGFKGSNGVFVQEASYQAAMQQHHLPLDIYMSYSHPTINTAEYFDSPFSIDAEKLRRCNESLFKDVRLYAMVSNDTDGVIVAHGPDEVTYSARCMGRWWLSPACRRDQSRCVPIITGGNGWSLLQMMQWVEAWQVPAAVAVAKDGVAYRELPKRHRMLFYWWVPDNSFVGLGARKIIWPRHNALDRRRTDTPEFTVEKFACAGLESTGIGFSQPLGLLRNMEILLPDIMELGKHVAEGQGDREDIYESVACEWLNANAKRYQDWIPLSTSCMPRQGLVNASGFFVATRADATLCDWCAPGRASKRIRDQGGTTYHCLKCPRGRFQKGLGRVGCDWCEEGTFAATRGAQSCQRCPVGEYAELLGQSACKACSPGMITTFMGATSMAGCICPEGSYRDGVERNLCLPCKAGMTCPAGADLLGYQPEHAARHPVVPLLNPGFWSSREEPLNVFRCHDELRCPGNRQPGNTCALNFELQGCGVCQAGFVLSGSTCVPCATGVAQVLLFPVLPLTLATLIVCIIYKMNGKPYERWGWWTKGASSAVFIVLNHYHVVNAIHELNVISERGAIEILETIALLSNIMSIFRPQCSGVSSFMSQLVMYSHGPGFLSFIYIFVWLCFWLIGLRRPDLRMDPNRLLNGYLSIIFTFFTRVTEMTFTVFKCADNPNGLFTLAQDRSILCYQGDWNGMVAVGASAALLWCICFSAVSLHAIFVAYRHFHELTFRKRWEFLFIRYRPDVHWWALVVLAKGVLLNLGPLFIHFGASLLYWCLLIILAYIALVFKFRPWRHAANNYLDFVVHLSLCLTCAIAVADWSAHSALQNVLGQTAMGVYVLKANMIFTAVPLIPVVAYMAWRDLAPQAKRRKEVKTRLILHAFQLMAEISVDDRAAFVERLTENDFRLISHTKDMLIMEFGNKKIRTGYTREELGKLSLTRICQERSDARGRGPSWTTRESCIADQKPACDGSSPPNDEAAEAEEAPQHGSLEGLTNMAAVEHATL